MDDVVGFVGLQYKLRALLPVADSFEKFVGGDADCVKSPE
jgi:hypothetical protein